MNETPLKDLLNQISPDEWRSTHPFTADMEGAQRAIFESNVDGEIRQSLLEWIGQYQPCLFGRMAARLHAIGTCIVSEGEILDNPEEWIAAKIDRARTEWLASTFKGKSSGFVLAVVSERVAYGRPDYAMSRFARRICSHYLGRGDIELDQIYLDEAYLAVPGDSNVTWKWLAGVNYFCANGDGRWWRDHRIPGGLAFSTNSVGHLAKSGILNGAQGDFWKCLGVDFEIGKTPVDSLPKALHLAMQTIHLASDGLSGKATELVERNIHTPPAPIELKSYLAGKEHRFYRGYYHTDHTLPSPYFETTAERPADIGQFDLDLSYLFDNSLSNPDHITMGTGRRIRREVEETKVRKAEGEMIEIASSPRLVAALEKYPSP
jgi:hypothetical protein